MLSRLSRQLFSRRCSAFYSSESAMSETENLLRATPSRPVQQSEPSTWKPFSDHSVIVLPRDFSYKSRHHQEPPPRRRPQVPPPPAQARYNDVFHQHDLDPLSLSLKPAMFYHYLSEIGKISGRSSTKLTMKSQRRIGKAIRRAKMMGIIPVHSLPKSTIGWGGM
ncbi:hypothetical protein F5887DRAFT_214259 [Amanita rubescens]|nr:hypothetical protein F5887DRAFT_214259 [Amanita rubescens]